MNFQPTKPVIAPQTIAPTTMHNSHTVSNLDVGDFILSKENIHWLNKVIHIYAF